MSQPTTVREVKECFVLSEKAKALANLDVDKFRQGLEVLKNDVRKMSRLEVDGVLRWRASLYDCLTWHWGAVTIDEVGVWAGAGGLPDVLCLGSVRETASAIVKSGGVQALPGRSDSRARDNIQGMMTVASLISKERLLSVIAEVGGTHRSTPPYKRMSWDLNDGSLRSIALALSGIQTLNAFFGV